MKILIIFIGKNIDSSYKEENRPKLNHIESIKSIYDYLINPLLTQQHTIDFGGVFSEYKDETAEIKKDKFKFLFISDKFQLSKLKLFFDNIKPFINDYDLFIKIRPDMFLRSVFDISNVKSDHINSRARSYTGPQIEIKNGYSVLNSFEAPCKFPYIHDLVMDDQMFIFEKTVANKFDYLKLETLDGELQNEWTHTKYWNILKIPKNIIGIDIFTPSVHGFITQSSDLIVV